MTAEGQVQHLAGRILGGRNAELDVIDLNLAVPDADFAGMQMLEHRADREAVLADRGAGGQADTRGNAVLIEEREPVATNKLAVGEQGGDRTSSAGEQEAFRVR